MPPTLNDKNPANDSQQPPTERERALRATGRYQPPPVTDDTVPQAELGVVRAHDLDLAPEEFAEGPYGSIRNDPRLGKVTPRIPNQSTQSPLRDAQPITSDRKVVLQQPTSTDPPGTIEGQN